MLTFDEILPILEDRMTQLGHPIDQIDPEKVKQFSIPFDATDLRHYQVEVMGKKAALSLYLINGGDSAARREVVSTYQSLSNNERKVGLAVGHHVHSMDDQEIFAHLVGGGGTNDLIPSLQEFLVSLFDPATVGINLGRAASRKKN